MALTRVSLTIPAGQTMSSAVDCSGFSILRIHIPSVWTSAPLTFQLSADGVTFRDMYHAASGPGDFASYEVSVPNPVPGSVIVMPAGAGAGIAFVRFRSGNHVTQIRQPADATFELVLEPDIADSGAGGGGSGAAGADGATGATGPQGPTGTAGVAGAVGPTGLPGAVGPVGIAGAVGPIGPTGVAGFAGATGAVGATGAKGATGLPGPTVVSADAGNQAKLGSDSLLLVSGLVPLSGATMTGVLHLKGVTDGTDAAVGEVGEYMSSMVPVASAKAANTGVAVDVTSVTLTPGIWDVYGQIWLAATGTRSSKAAREALAATACTGIAAWVSTVSATMPSVPAGSLQSFFGIQIQLTSSFLPVLASGHVRFSVATPTPVYLSGLVTYTGSGPIGLYGFLGARRVR